MATQFREGDKAVLFYWAANRDETMFAEPDRFDITRSPNPHVGFGGAGPHFCLGAHLARREITAVLRELLSRVPHARGGRAGPAAVELHQWHQAPALRPRLAARRPLSRPYRALRSSLLTSML